VLALTGKGQAAIGLVRSRQAAPACVLAFVLALTGKGQAAIGLVRFRQAAPACVLALAADGLPAIGLVRSRQAAPACVLVFVLALTGKGQAAIWLVRLRQAAPALAFEVTRWLLARSRRIACPSSHPVSTGQQAGGGEVAMPVRDEWTQELAELEARGLRRSLRVSASAPGRTVVLDGREVLDFSSNNYLGLADHPVLARAAIQATERHGTGAGAARLVLGTQPVHVELEQALAAFHHQPAALLFNSGYHANIGVLQALSREGDVVFSDALNHASIIDGCRLGRGRVIVYPHRDVAALADLLARHRGRRRIVVTDSVFSMDGDRAPVAELAVLCREHDAVLMLDEAHATGALGPGGRGIAAEAGVVPDVHVGTLGKSLGSFGAYVFGERSLVELLANRARSFVFTTALPPGVVAATLAAVHLLQSATGDALRARLADHIARFRQGLAALGLLQPGAGTTPIFPVLIGDERQTMACSQRLLERGIHAQGIRPPTVPPGTSRLRFALMATHEPEDLERALAELDALVRAGLLPSNSPGTTQ
jgi:8-amino-7-oxononanoate synthase